MFKPIDAPRKRCGYGTIPAAHALAPAGVNRRDRGGSFNLKIGGLLVLRQAVPFQSNAPAPEPVYTPVQFVLPPGLDPGRTFLFSRRMKKRQIKAQGLDDESDSRYRRGVGVMLLNRKGEVFVAARIDNTDEAWQMPQGGIDEGEDPWTTALRELEEETGIAPHLVERIADCTERLKYDLPPKLRPKLWGGKYKGQDQDWYLARFLGRDSDINIATKHPEFREWKWIRPEQLPELIVQFKRDLYRRLLREFADHL